MTFITSDQYDGQIESLAGEIRSLREEIAERTEKLRIKEDLHQKTIDLRDAAFPPKNTRRSLSLAEEFSMDFVPKKRRKLPEYFPYILNVINVAGASLHYKRVADGLRESMKDADIKDGYVYKILRGMEQANAGVIRDPKNEGHFMLIQGGSDAHSVGADSGSYNKKIASPDQGVAMDA